MKKTLLLLTMVMALASCSSRLIEKAEVLFPDGKPETVRYYDKNNMCVREVQYYQSGQVKMEGPMKNGKMEGEWKAFFPDGRMQSHGYFKDGERTGKSMVWRQNGNMQCEGFYRDGKKCGNWKWYDEQGILVKEINHGNCD